MGMKKIILSLLIACFVLTLAEKSYANSSGVKKDHLDTNKIGVFIRAAMANGRDI